MLVNIDTRYCLYIFRSCQGAGGGWDSDDEVRVSQVFFRSVFDKRTAGNREDLEQKKHQKGSLRFGKITRWLFQIRFIFTPILGDNPF